MTTDLRAMTDRVLLGMVVWREARGESDECRAAVAHSVLNRVSRPTWWGRTVLTVVARKWQYSSMTAPGDPQLILWPIDGDASWWECLQIACDVLDGEIPNTAPGADSYFDVSIQPPKWAKPEMFVKQIGRIRFYNIDRDITIREDWP